MPGIMIQGTTSSAGKSLICAGLCRIFKEDGYSVFPFKSQNMSSKFYTTIDGKKMSTAQALQAIAAGLEPEPDMNPILLIPNSDTGSLVVINGQDSSIMAAKDYFKYRVTLRKMIEEKYNKIRGLNDIVVIEGAGSPAEINLNENDIVNMGMAKIADAPVLLVTDIDRGGAFAALYGTVMLLGAEERSRIKGMIINKFRGDKDLLAPGIKMIEELLNIPVVGVIPYMDLELLDGQFLVHMDKNYVGEAIEQELDKAAKTIRENMDMQYIYKLVETRNV
ncbi:MAG TPA: cobyric acid synthase [Clostridia bacterium]|nr:cobyric acid synthase [Clostridia bacterium]